MVGGHVKALVPPVSRLAIPTVTATAVFGCREPGSQVLNEVTFACLGNRMRVTILKRP
jgi:hypothetical protein